MDTTQSSNNTEAAERNLVIQAEVVSTFVKRIVNCRTVAQLVSFVPAIVQDRTKNLLDEQVLAHIKGSAAKFLLDEWRDSLAKENFKPIPELKSLRAPSLQISKIAEQEGSISCNFDDALKEAKKTTLVRMIEIKAKELEALTNFCHIKNRAQKLHNVWATAALADGVSAEASALLSDPSCTLSLIQSASSIGENTALKYATAKAKKTEVVKKTQVDATSVMPEDKKGLEAFVKAIANRQRQSAQDKAKAKTRKSGKGQRGAGPSKTKNQKNSPKKVGKKGRKPKNGKPGTSSGKQRNKR